MQSAARTASARLLLLEMLDVELIIRSFGFSGGTRLPASGCARDTTEQQCEVRRTGRMLDRLFVGDKPLLHECRKALVERDHAVGMQTLGNRIFNFARSRRLFDHFANALG